MNIIQLVVVGIITAILAVTVKKQSPEMALIISIIGGVIIFISILARMTGLIGLLTEIAEKTGIDLAYTKIVLKIIGIAYVAEFGMQICKDAGEGAIASKLELAGKVMIMAVSAPILVSLLDLILSMFPEV